MRKTRRKANDPLLRLAVLATLFPTKVTLQPPFLDLSGLAEAPQSEAQRRASFEAEKAKKREGERAKRRIAELEDLIAAGERELEAMRRELREDPGGDWEKLASRAKAEQALAQRVDAMVAEWTKLSGGA